MDYYAPTEISDALAVLEHKRPRVVAGCTDVFPSQADAPLRGPILDVTGVHALQGICEAGDGWRIGAAATWTDLLLADLPPAFDGLKLAAREVGSVQIQNRATLVGNLCNASPAADGVPPLLTLDASVEVVSAGMTRVVPLLEFIAGPRSVNLNPGEMVTAILIPKPLGQGAFLKLGSRTHLVISIVMVAARLSINVGSIDRAWVAVGSCSAVARRLPRLEQKLLGRTVDGAFNTPIAAEDLVPLAPIDDVRGSAPYRMSAAQELIKRTLRQALRGA